MLSHPTTEQLLAAGLDPAAVEQIVQNALDEDPRYGPDVPSAATTPAGAEAVGAVVARRPGVLAGLPVALAVLDLAVPDWTGPDLAVSDRAGLDRPVTEGAGLDLTVSDRTGLDRSVTERAGLDLTVSDR